MRRIFADEGIWKLLVEKAKRNKHAILCNGPPERSYGFAIYADRKSNSAQSNYCEEIDGKNCFRCRIKHQKVYYEWIHCKNDEKSPLGSFQPLCHDCFTSSDESI